MFTPTGDYPNIALPDLRIRLINRLSHQISSMIMMGSSRSGFKQVRHRAGLPKRKLFWPFDDNPYHHRTPILCAWSPSILPPSSDWPMRVHVTGYYFFPFNNHYQPSVELGSFLRAGKPPICVTFGSMVNRNAEKIDRIVRDALKQTDNRGVILSGWGGIKNQTSSDLFYVESVSHDWLLPQCKMVIHHGGAGTTSAGLRAGIPSIIVPFTADQPFWGKRVHAVGVGPKPILVKNLSIEKLAHAIFEAEKNAIREQAQVIGQEIRSEDGVDNAINLIEMYVRDFKTNADSAF